MVSWDEAKREANLNLIGWLHGMFVHMTYAERGEHLRIISLRAATKHEIKNYHQATSRK